MRTRHLQRFFAPESIVVVGASERPESFGGYVLRNLLAAGFRGETYAVNADGDATVFGVPRFASMSALPAPPDLAVLCTPPESIPADIRALGKARVKAALVLFGGLPQEPGGGLFQWARELLGLPLQTLREATLRAAARYDLRIMGPNCMGIISPRSRLNASFSPLNPAPGETAFVGQCGMLGLAFADWAERRRVGFSHLLTLGDSVDVDLADVIEYLGQDTETRVILLHIERFPDGPRFLSAVRAAARSKLVIALKSGRSHELDGTAASVPPGLRDLDAVYDAVLARAGVLRIDRSDELVDAMASLAHFRGLGGEGLAIVANGFGPGTLGADALVGSGGRLARLDEATVARLRELLPATWNGRNPIDLAPDATPGRYRRTLEALSQDPGVDAILVVLVPTAFAPPLKVAQAVIAARANVRQPVCASWLGESTVQEARDLLHSAGVPSFNMPEQAVGSFMGVVRYRRAQTALQQTPRFLPETAPAEPAALEALLAATHGRSGPFGEEASLAVLHALGIGDPAPRETVLPDDAPVLSLGITRDATFGPLLLFGEAGRSGRPPAQRAVGLPPLNHTLARLVVGRTAFGRELQDRAGAEWMLELACLTLVRLGRLVIEAPGVSRLETEVALMPADRVHVLAASIELGEPMALAIAPYPEHLRETVRLPATGREIELRPIRSEDEPKHLAFIARLSPTAIRYRTFAARSNISHRDLALLTQIDYTREMAFVAESATADGDTEILGAVRCAVDPDNVSAEFAIVVRDDLVATGLGRLLLEKMIRYARERGTLRLFGLTLPENERMRGLAERLGFSSRSDDEGLVLLELPLNEPRSDWQRERL